jgi:hypothetical protein
VHGVGAGDRRRVERRIAAGATTTIAVSFHPPAPGARSAALSVTSGGDAAVTVPLTGLGIADTSAPVITVPADITVEATGAATPVTFTVAANDPVDGTVTPICTPASGFGFPVGTTTVSCTATDPHGNSASASFAVAVTDTTAPTTPVLAVTPSVLWPPNHKMVAIGVSARATDAVSAVSCAIANVASSEPDTGLGDGDTDHDIGPIAGLTTSLRAERSSGGSGRVYTLTVACHDEAGNTSSSTATVIVPKRQERPHAVDGTARAAWCPTGSWLLATGYWLLATGYWLLATGYWLLATGW